MDLQEIYKEKSGYDVGRYNIDNTNYYSEDYVEWLEKKLRTLDVVNQSEKYFCCKEQIGQRCSRQCLGCFQFENKD